MADDENIQNTFAIWNLFVFGTSFATSTSTSKVSGTGEVDDMMNAINAMGSAPSTSSSTPPGNTTFITPTPPSSQPAPASTTAHIASATPPIAPAALPSEPAPAPLPTSSCQNNLPPPEPLEPSPAKVPKNVRLPKGGKKGKARNVGEVVPQKRTTLATRNGGAHKVKKTETVQEAATDVEEGPAPVRGRRLTRQNASSNVISVQCGDEEDSD